MLTIRGHIRYYSPEQQCALAAAHNDRLILLRERDRLFKELRAMESRLDGLNLAISICSDEQLTKD